MQIAWTSQVRSASEQDRLKDGREDVAIDSSCTKIQRRYAIAREGPKIVV